MDQPGVVIAGEHYPFDTGFQLGDAPLVFDVTGMEWDEFAEALDSGGSARTIGGLIAVAVWRRHPDWRRARVVKFVERLDLETVDFTGGDEGDAEGPPAETEPVAPPPGSSSISIVPSEAAPADGPSAASPDPTGTPVSAIGAA